MFVRISSITGDPAKLGEGIKHIEEVSRPAVEATPGNKGFAVFADEKAGTVLAASYWDTKKALDDSYGSLTSTRQSAAARTGGSVSSESYEVAVAMRNSWPKSGAVIRLVRLEIDPADMDSGIELYRSHSLPTLQEADGLCSAQLLADRAVGKLLGVTAWADPGAAEASRAVGEKVRAEAVAKTSMTVKAIEEYSLVSTTVQLP
jgi:quinol monooxygenase YgiN